MPRFVGTRSFPEPAGPSLFAPHSTRFDGMFLGTADTEAKENQSPASAAPAKPAGPEPKPLSTGCRTENSVTAQPTTSDPAAAVAAAFFASAAVTEKEEQALREIAIERMTCILANSPNGTTRRAPIWYRRPDDLPSTTSGFPGHPIFSRRPRFWIKDWDTGVVRPRIMMDDFRKAKMEREAALAKRKQQQAKAKAETWVGSSPSPSPSAAANKAKTPSATADISDIVWVSKPSKGKSKSKKRKAIHPDESEAEKGQQQSPTELGIRVRAVSKKRRRLAQDFEPLPPRYEISGYSPDDDDDSVRGSFSANHVPQPQPQQQKQRVVHRGMHSEESKKPRQEHDGDSRGE